MRMSKDFIDPHIGDPIVLPNYLRVSDQRLICWAGDHDLEWFELMLGAELFENTFDVVAYTFLWKIR